MTLNDLALYFNTDKSDRTHNYCPIYESLFDSISHLVTQVLEIGISEGGSIKMWRDYFPNAVIHGIDKDQCIDCGERTINYVCDQSDDLSLKQIMEAINEDFDFILDDGSHDPEHIITSLNTLYPYLKSGGLYCIEDLEHPRILDEQLKGYTHWIAVADSPILNSNIIVIRKP